MDCVLLMAKWFYVTMDLKLGDARVIMQTYFGLDTLIIWKYKIIKTKHVSQGLFHKILELYLYSLKF